MSEFKVGQDIVYPKYGLGKVVAIKTKKLPRGRVKGVEIKFPAMHMKVWVPEERLKNTKVRKPVSKYMARKIYATLKKRARFRMGTKAKERAMQYKAKVLSGDPIDLAEAVRDLIRLSTKKSLNVREAEIANTALRTLVRELSLATGKPIEVVKEEVDKILYR
jgi:CarD family transcriptional regulator